MKVSLLSYILEKISETQKLYLRGRRISSKFREKSTLSRHEGLNSDYNRNIQTDSYNIRIKTENIKQSLPRENDTIGSICLKRELNYNPQDRSNSSFTIRRPKTKQGENQKRDLNQTFVPYYENKTKEKFSKNIIKKLSTAAIVSKPKTVQEWRRKNLKPNTKVFSALLRVYRVEVITQRIRREI